MISEEQFHEITTDVEDLSRQEELRYCFNAIRCKREREIAERDRIQREVREREESERGSG
jgi:hypothetical protein